MSTADTLIKQSKLFSPEGKIRLIEMLKNASQEDRESISDVLLQEKISENKNEALFFHTLTQQLRGYRFQYLEGVEKQEQAEIEMIINNL